MASPFGTRDSGIENRDSGICSLVGGPIPYSPIPFPALLALGHRHVLPPLGAGEELARAADLLIGVADELVPLRDPAHRARQREDRGEHRHRYAERLVDDAGIEVDVGIELALDEVLVLER